MLLCQRSESERRLFSRTLHHLERPNTVPAANQPNKRLITDCISQNALEVMEALQTWYCRYMPVVQFSCINITYIVLILSY